MPTKKVKDDFNKLKIEVKEELKNEIKDELKYEIKQIKDEIKDQIRDEIKDQIKDMIKDQIKDIKVQIRDEIKDVIKDQIKEDIKVQIRDEIKDEIKIGFEKVVMDLRNGLKEDIVADFETIESRIDDIEKQIKQLPDEKQSNFDTKGSIGESLDTKLKLVPNGKLQLTKRRLILVLKSSSVSQFVSNLVTAVLEFKDVYKTNITGHSEKSTNYVALNANVLPEVYQACKKYLPDLTKNDSEVMSKSSKSFSKKLCALNFFIQKVLKNGFELNKNKINLKEYSNVSESDLIDWTGFDLFEENPEEYCEAIELERVKMNNLNNSNDDSDNNDKQNGIENEQNLENSDLNNQKDKNIFKRKEDETDEDEEIDNEDIKNFFKIYPEQKKTFFHIKE